MWSDYVQASKDERKNVVMVKRQQSTQLLEARMGAFRFLKSPNDSSIR